jgi:hypothetical protein
MYLFWPYPSIVVWRLFPTYLNKRDLFKPCLLEDFFLLNLVLEIVECSVQCKSIPFLIWIEKNSDMFSFFKQSSQFVDVDGESLL